MHHSTKPSHYLFESHAFFSLYEMNFIWFFSLQHFSLKGIVVVKKSVGAVMSIQKHISTFFLRNFFGDCELSATNLIMIIQYFIEWSILIYKYISSLIANKIQLLSILLFHMLLRHQHDIAILTFSMRHSIMKIST